MAEVYKEEGSMAFTNRDFPGRVFSSIREYEEACALRKAVEKRLEEPTSIVARILPAAPEAIERRLLDLEKKVRFLLGRISRKRAEPSPGENREGIQVGMVLVGDSKGQEYSLEVLPDRYLCSDGRLYESLSGAALGVSGTRRSGWRFWRDSTGRPIGEVVGRFDAEAICEAE